MVQDIAQFAQKWREELYLLCNIPRFREVNCVLIVAVILITTHGDVLAIIAIIRIEIYQITHKHYR